MIALDDLEIVLGNMKFPPSVKNADQAGTTMGERVRGDAGVELVGSV